MNLINNESKLWWQTKTKYYKTTKMWNVVKKRVHRQFNLGTDKLQQQSWSKKEIKNLKYKKVFKKRDGTTPVNIDILTQQLHYLLQLQLQNWVHSIGH